LRLDVLLEGSGFPKLRSAVTLIRAKAGTVLVDSGPIDERERLLGALDAFGVAAQEVDFVVSTHLHSDHCGNHLAFPRARWLVSVRDYEDARSFLTCYHADPSHGKSQTAELLRTRNETIKDFYVRSIIREVTRNQEFYDIVLRGDPRFVPVASPLWVTRGVEAVPSPGHTPGHLSVVAHDAQLADLTGPVDVLVAGDAILNRRSLEASDERALPLAADAGQYHRTCRRLRERYRCIVPGHDGLLHLGASPGASVP